MDETKKKEERPDWTQTPLGGLVCGVLIFGVLAAFIIIYPPSDYEQKDESK